MTMDLIDDGDEQIIVWNNGAFKTEARNINRVWRILNDTFQQGDWTTSKFVALQVINELRLPVNPEEIWGGKNRARYLFPLIYYPLKYLEKEGRINFTGRGDIQIRG